MQSIRFLLLGLVAYCLCPFAVLRAGEPLAAAQLVLPDHLQATLWAKAPMFYNPTNIDVDHLGRVWVAEAVNYRAFKSHGKGQLKHQAGDRIMVLEDTNGDGKADKSSVFVQDKDLRAPLGIAVFGNRIVVSCSPSVIVYTDTNNNAKFDAGTDKKEIFLTGFGGVDHDHGLHAVVAGPDGRWYLNAGNAGPHVVKDRSGWTLRAGGWYSGGGRGSVKNAPGAKSDDGRVYVGGLAMSIQPDGDDLSVHSHNFRNNYEICLDSFGNVFQNDNDDQVVTCRTTWLMQYGNAGYSSADGQRSWQADKRPGQTTPAAHWHQEDPGVLPYGDLYGAGSPTGMVVYEGDAMGDKFRGMLLSCEAGRNVVFGYHVRDDGAGFDLKRFSFCDSGRPDNRDYKWKEVEKDRRSWFRPSDVSVGPDGAIYIADWFDPIVGGHAMHDLSGVGAIYRVTPKNKKLVTPKIDLNMVEGQLAALKSPGPNVRFLGFEKLRAQGDNVLPAVSALRKDGNPFVRARATYLMAKLGDKGRSDVVALLASDDSNTRLTAIRALRNADEDIQEHLRQLAADRSPAVRREVALALRDVPLADCDDILLQLANGFDGLDRWYLEAFGTACEGKENEFYSALHKELGDAPLKWSQRFASLIWRLHPTDAIDALEARAICRELSVTERKQAIDTLAFTSHARAAEAMIKIVSKGPEDLRVDAAWWIGFRRNNLWRGFDAAKNYKPLNVSEPNMVAGVRLPPLPAYNTDTIRRGDVADISVDISGADHLYLVVTDAGDGNSCDWADWAEPRLVGPQGEVKLTDLTWAKAATAFGKIGVDRNCSNLPLSINGRKVPFGIGTHATSVIAYEISGKNFQRFEARCGLDNGRKDLGGTDYPDSKPSVIFQVYHDGPTPKMRAREHELILLNKNIVIDKRKESARAMARSRVGGLQLLGLASRDKLPAELYKVVGQHIHLNPNMSVRALAGQYFKRSSADGKPIPTIKELLKTEGDAVRGRQLVFEKAECAKCHQFGGEGKMVGPDLTNIGRKLDRERLFDSILNPSASIVFGFETWLIEIDDGRVLTGFIVGEGDPVLLKDAKGEQHAIPANAIEFRKRQPVSIMPELAKAGLTAQELADVVEFLMTK